MAIITTQTNLSSRPAAPKSAAVSSQVMMRSRPFMVTICPPLLSKNAAVGLKLPAVTDNNVLLVRDYRVLGGSSAMQQNDRFIKWL